METFKYLLDAWTQAMVKYLVSPEKDTIHSEYYRDTMSALVRLDLQGGLDADVLA